jgi:acyl transferase domain-containing protein
MAPMVCDVKVALHFAEAPGRCRTWRRSDSAVIRGVAVGDGRGKGITAPNPAGQVLAFARGKRWTRSVTATFEAHGTSTKVMMVEVESLSKVFGAAE